MTGAAFDPRTGALDEAGRGLEHDITMVALACAILGVIVLLFAFDVFKRSRRTSPEQ